MAVTIDSRISILPIPHQFLAEMAKRGDLPWKKEVRSNAALHTHVGRTGHNEGQRRARIDRESTAALLRTVPGVVLIDEVQAPLNSTTTAEQPACDFRLLRCKKHETLSWNHSERRAR